MDKNNIAAIVFDAYGTLFNIASLDAKLSHYFGSDAKPLAQLWRRKQLEYTWLRSMMNRYKDFINLTEDALLYASKKLGLSFKDAIKQDLIDTYYKLDTYPEVGEALQLLHSQYQLAILSNGNIELLKGSTQHNGIHGHFAAIYSADTIQQYKPLPFVYQLPVDGLKVSKSKILFVSTNTWDVAGAKSFGMNVAWIKRDPLNVTEELGFEPDLIIEDLMQLNYQLATSAY